MREVYTILDNRSQELKFGNKIKAYLEDLRNHNVEVLTIFQLLNNNVVENQEIWEKINNYCVGLGIELRHYGLDVLDFEASIYNSLSNRRVRSLNHYLLVELPKDGAFEEHYYDYLLAIKQMKYIPVIINIQNHPYLYQDESIIRNLIDMGCMVMMDISKLDVNKPSDDFEALVRLHGRGLCHMVIPKFYALHKDILAVRTWMSYSFTRYIADIEMLDNVECMIEGRVLAGLSNFTNILDYPSFDAMLVDDRWQS